MGKLDFPKARCQQTTQSRIDSFSGYVSNLALFLVCLYVCVFIFGGGLGQIGQRSKYLCSRTWFLSTFSTLTLGLLPSPRFQEYQIGESFKNLSVCLLSSLICLNVTSFVFAFLFYLKSVLKIEK